MALRKIETDPVEAARHNEVQRSIAGARMGKIGHRTDDERKIAEARWKANRPKKGGSDA